MSKMWTWLDRAALMLTGGGVIGGALAAIDVLPAPSGVVCAMALGVGAISSLAVELYAVCAHEKDVDDLDLDVDVANWAHPDAFRLKTPITDPLDPTVPGTVNWNVQFSQKPQA